MNLDYSIVGKRGPNPVLLVDCVQGWLNFVGFYMKRVSNFMFNKMVYRLDFEFQFNQ